MTDVFSQNGFESSHKEAEENAPNAADELYNGFLAPDFSESDTITKNIRNSSNFLEQLSRSVRRIDEQIQEQVVSRHSDLLNQSTYIHTIEDDLQRVRNRIGALQNTTQKVSEGLIVPFNELQQRSLQLSNVQLAGGMLRHTLRVLQLLKKLGAHTKAGNKDITKAAQTVSDIETILHETGLSGINVIDEKLGVISRAGAQIRDEGKRLLWKAIDSLDQSEIANALQIFYNLSDTELVEVVQSTIQRVERNSLFEIRRTLDLSTLGERGSLRRQPESGSSRPDVPPIGSGSSWRSSLWTRTEGLTSALYQSAMQVWSLERVLWKKHDPLTQRCFMNVIKEGEEDILLFDSFWIALTNLISKEMQVASKGSSFVRSVFVNEYPRLFNHFKDLFTRIEKSTNPHPGDRRQKSMGTGKFSLLIGSLSVFDSGFLDKSLSKLEDPVKYMFAGDNDTVPTMSDLSTLTLAIDNEISAVEDTPELQKPVMQRVSQCVILFAEEATELSIATAPQTSVMTTDDYQKNGDIYNMSSKLMNYISSMRKKHEFLSDTSEPLISDAKEHLHNLCVDISWRLLGTACKNVEIILLSSHQEDFSGSSEIAAEGSKFVQKIKYEVELLKKLLPLFRLSESLKESTLKFVKRVVSLFICHASLISPISEKGALKLAGDIAHYEDMLSSLIQQTHLYEKRDYDVLFEDLRSFKALLFFHGEEIIKSPQAQSLPASIVLQYLLCKSVGICRGKDDVKPLYEVLDWNIEKYCEWVNEHLDAEIVEVLCGIYRKVRQSTQHLRQLEKDSSLRENQTELLSHIDIVGEFVTKVQNKT